MQWGFAEIGQLGTFAPSGDLFCKKGVGISLLAFPLFWFSSLFPEIGAVHGALLTNAVLTALTGCGLFRCLLAIGFSRRDSLVCALVFGMGTLAWPCARLFFSEPVASAGLLLAFYGCALFHLRASLRSALYCGLGTGIAILALPGPVRLAHR